MNFDIQLIFLLFHLQEQAEYDKDKILSDIWERKMEQAKNSNCKTLLLFKILIRLLSNFLEIFGYK